MRIIIGGDSTIGRALSYSWKEKGISFQSSTRKPNLVNPQRPFIDLVSKDWKKIKENKFKVGVLCAAITSIEKCEKDPVFSKKVNVEGRKQIVNELIEKKTHIIMLSSNQVFDGSKKLVEAHEPTNPINEYGKQNAELEEYILNFPKTTVFRLTKVIHNNLSILKDWKEKLENGQEIFPFKDLTLAPISLKQVLQSIEKIISNKAYGIKQLSAENEISYEDFAYDFCKKVGIDTRLVSPINFKDKFKDSITPPEHCSLRTSDDIN